MALVGTVGHVADIGGTRDSLRAREIFGEGLQIPPMKLARAGVDNDDLFTLIGGNVRNPGQVVGDIQVFMSANQIAARNGCWRSWTSTGWPTSRRWPRSCRTGRGGDAPAGFATGIIANLRR